MCYLQSDLELTKVIHNHVTFQSPAESRYKPAANWIMSAAACNSMVYIGDSSGQLTQMNFTAIENQRKVR